MSWRWTRPANALIAGAGAELGRSWLAAGPVNWIDGGAASRTVRGGGADPLPGHACPRPWSSHWPTGTPRRQFAAALRDITPGQGAVFYQGERCLGGGTISRTRSGEERAV